MKFFSKKKFLESRAGRTCAEVPKWVDVCEGKPVVKNVCNGGYLILDEWCVDGKTDSSHRYRITIDCDGVTTTATLTVDDVPVKTRKAHLSPDDTFSLRKGCELAFQRIFEKKEKEPSAQRASAVKRYAKPGDWVQIVNPSRHNANTYKRGSIIRVIGLPEKRSKLEGWVYLDGTFYATAPWEYVVLEGYRPKRGKDGKNA